MKSGTGIRAFLRIVLSLSFLLSIAGNGLVLARSGAAGGDQPYVSGDQLIFGEALKSAEMQVDSSSFAAVELTARASQVQIAKTDLLGKQYLAFSGEGLGKGAKIGNPDLPVLRRDVEIPFGARASLELISSKYTEVKLADLGLLANILPVQPAQPKCGDPVEPCQPDAAVYQQDAFFPASPLAIGGEYEVRGHRALTVETWPVAYNPVQGTLRLYSEVRFRIRLEGSDVVRTLSESARLASPAFEGTLSKTLLNYNMGKGARLAQDLNTVNYLIITADAYYTGLADFVAMKEAQGFTVTVAKTSVIGATKEAIKAYITTLYSGATPPSYVLFVGDTDTVPNWPFKTSGETSYLTDLYHVTMGGVSDFVPDIYRGRFPVRSAAQLTNMVNNNLWYKNSVTGAEPWVKKIAYLATDDSGNYTTAEATHNYCISTYTQPKGYTGIFPVNPQPGGDKLYAITHSAGTTNVVNSLNDGRVMTIYSGHGSQTSWAGPSVSQTNVRGLTGNLIPYVVGHACVTADFNTAEAFSDTWVIQPNKGALVYVGASDNSYWDEDDRLQRVMFDTFYDPAPGDPSISQALYAGLGAVQSTYPSSGQYYWEEYNLFGDPSLVIVTG
ncbi:MAG TPA: C25 family cysteine peptidase, partial [Anaerolineaceae bacterium]|nr:C25 family cysteine peptidase [Anaerolineaceae bacterium]